MKALILLRWVAMKWAREPWKWALFAVLVGLWPAMRVFAPFGASPTPVGSHDPLYEVAFVAAGLGAACALDALEVLPACSYALGIRPGWPAEWVALVAGGVAGQTAAVGLPLAVTRGRDLGLDIELAAQVALSSVYLASVGLLLLRVPMPAGLRALGLLGLTWILPALTPPSFLPGLLGTGPHPTFGDFSNRALVMSRLASIFALLLGAHLMDAQRQQRP